MIVTWHPPQTNVFSEIFRLGFDDDDNNDVLLTALLNGALLVVRGFFVVFVWLGIRGPTSFEISGVYEQ